MYPNIRFPPLFHAADITPTQFKLAAMKLNVEIVLIRGKKKGW